MASSTAKEVAAATGHRRVTIETPHAPTHGLNNDEETEVKAVYDYFLRFDGKGPHYEGARSWSHVRMERVMDPHYYFFLLMLLLVESKSEGCTRPIADRNDDRQAYERTVSLAARAQMGLATGQQQQTLKHLVYQDLSMDRRFAHDVQCAKNQIQRDNAAAAAKDGAQKKGAKKKANDESRAKRTVAAPGGDSYRSWVKDFQMLVVDGGITILPTVDREEMYRAPPPVPVQAVPAQEPAPKRSRVAAAAEGDGDEEDDPTAVAALAHAPPPPIVDPEFNGPEYVPKIQFTVTPVPHHDRPDDVDEPAGLMVRFIVHDPTINPGRFFRKIMTNMDMRHSRAMAPAQRGPPMKGTSEMFPAYASLYHTQHPAGNLTGTLATYFNSAVKICPELITGEMPTVKLMNMMNMVDPKSKFHLANIMTTERALEVMRDAGAVRDYCVDAVQWWDQRNNVARFPRELTTYKYNSISVFWSNPKFIGLSEQFFPHINMESDFISSLVAGRNLAEFLDDRFAVLRAPAAGAILPGTSALSDKAATEQRRVLTVFEEIRNLLKDSCPVDRSLLMSTNLVSYQTNNEFVHRAAEASIINKRVMQECPSHYLQTLATIQEMSAQYGRDGWRDRIRGEQLMMQVLECERYNEIRGKAQQSCLKNFCSLWQLEGNVDDLPIPYPIKAMLTWYRDNHATKFPNMTRGFILLDPDLGTFGNSMMRQVQMYARVGRILQPIVCMICEALFSCYQYTPKELASNLMIHGKFDVGKTYAAITTLLNYTTIENTVKQFVVATKAADTSQNHKYDLIIASDEVAPYKVSVKEAEKFPEQVNKEKIKMTSRQVGLECFGFEKGPNGEDVRWTKTITMDHYVSLLEVTNHVVEANNPLASRYHRMTMAQPKIPAREMNGIMGESLKSSTVLYMQINQFLSAAAWKAIMCGAMLMPDMQLFDDISNRVINYLTEQKAISADIGYRGLEIMKPYARQLVVKHAIHCVFDMPSGVHYMKKFESSMIHDLQPYLYCTVDIVWWCWTALASGWIEENISSVIRAARKLAGIKEEDWDDDATPYEMYEKDVMNVIKWRKVDNPKGTQVEVKGDEKLVDLRYICLEGDFKTICRKLAAQTSNPKLHETDVHGVLNVLKDRSIDTPNFPLPQEEVTFAKWHKYFADATGKAGEIKYTDPDGSATMPAKYRQVNPNGADFRAVTDIPCENYDAKCQAVEMQYGGGGLNKLYIMPHIASTFRNEKIKHALWYATACRTTRPGKILLGLPHDKDHMCMQVWRCPEQMIRQQVAAMDEADGWKLDPRTGDLVWTKNPGIPEEERPVPRQTQGIAFNRRGGIAESDSLAFTATHLAPIREGDTSWRNKIEDDIKNMSSVRDISYDLDADSARRQHMLSGRPLDEPVRTPAWILQQYELACRARGMKVTAGMNYPFDSLVDGSERAYMWNATSSSKNVAKLSREHLDFQNEQEHIEETNPRLRDLLAKRKETELIKRRGGVIDAPSAPAMIQVAAPVMIQAAASQRPESSEPVQKRSKNKLTVARAAH